MKTQAKKISNDGTGQCDNCGKELGASKWRKGESTGCTKRCADEDYQRDLIENIDPDDGLIANLDKLTG